jgi:D-3-phosphoglycerate dehydrogenase
VSVPAAGGTVVLVTDYVWPSLDREREILQTAGARVVAAPAGDEETLAALARDADAILTCFAQVTPRVIAAGERVRIIARYGIGLDNIAVSAATARGIVVTNVPDYCVHEVAEHTMALLLACTRRVALYDRAVRGGAWDPKIGRPLRRLAGRTLGIVGLGSIGRLVARQARALGLHVLAHSRSLTEAEASRQDVRAASLGEVLREADIVSLHVPLTEATRGLLDAAALAQMRRGSYLINTSRGGLVDTAALAAALASGYLAGAALDVLPHEPPLPGDPLLAQENVVLTPHAAFYSEEAVAELQTRAATEVARVLGGQAPLHPVNAHLLPGTRRGTILER